MKGILFFDYSRKFRIFLGNLRVFCRVRPVMEIDGVVPQNIPQYQGKTFFLLTPLLWKSLSHVLTDLHTFLNIKLKSPSTWKSLV